MTPLDTMHATFTRWFGEDYDLDAIDVVVAAAAAIRLDGDPLWVLLVGGPGNAKTETVAALAGTGAYVVSTIASEGALLSGTSRGERADDATGGLLRQIGDVGVIVLKDFTSILSLPQSTRPGVLAALRETYDGHWVRSIGADGGRNLEWTGRLCIIGAVTTAWDQTHATVSSMGDRFVLLRLDSIENRLAAGRQAIRNTGSETLMRQELSDSVAAVLAPLTPGGPDFGTPCGRADQDTTGGARGMGDGLSETNREHLLRAANLVTHARTAVNRDRAGNVTEAHAPEMPTRFAKQLTQIVRGAISIGMTTDHAMGLAIRCARDSVPPLRLAILRDIAEHGPSRTADVQRRISKPRNTVDRELQALHLLGILTLEESRYSLASGIDTTAVFPEIEVPPLPLGGVTPHGSTSFSGNGDLRCAGDQDCPNAAEPGWFRCSAHRESRAPFRTGATSDYDKVQ